MEHLNCSEVQVVDSGADGQGCVRLCWAVLAVLVEFQQSESGINMFLQDLMLQRYVLSSPQTLVQKFRW